MRHLVVGLILLLLACGWFFWRDDDALPFAAANASETPGSTAAAAGLGWAFTADQRPQRRGRRAPPTHGMIGASTTRKPTVMEPMVGSCTPRDAERQ